MTQEQAPWHCGQEGVRLCDSSPWCGFRNEQKSSVPPPTTCISTLLTLASLHSEPRPEGCSFWNQACLVLLLQVPPAHPVTFLVQRCLGGQKQQNSRLVLPELASSTLLRSRCLGRNEITDNPAHFPQVKMGPAGPG